MQPANRATSASEIDALYQSTCAQIGQSYLKRVELVNQLNSLDADLERLKEAAHQHVAAYRAAAQND